MIHDGRTYSIKGMIWRCLISGCLSVTVSSGALAQRYVDPRVGRNMDGYRAWCKAQYGGTGRVDTSAGVACVGDPRHSSYSGGAGWGSSAGQALGAAMAPLFYELGRDIGCMLVGGCSDPRAAAEAQRRAEALEAERRAAEADRLRKEEEAKRKFQAAQQRMLGELRGYDFDSLQPRSSGLPTLEPRLGMLGATELKPRDIATPSSLSTQGRVRCAVSLLYKANRAYVDINTQAALWEAAYLSNEAASIAGSSTYRPTVECPPDPPQVGAGAPTADAQAQLQRIQRSAILFARVQQQIADLETQKITVHDTEAKVKETQQQIAEMRRRVQQLEQQRVTAPLIAAGGADSQQQKDDGALAEAMAALRQAEDAFQSSRELLREQQNQLTDMQRNLNGSTKELQSAMKSWSAAPASARPGG